MNDRSYVALSMLAGAVVGGLAGFLMFTERGRRLRAEVQPHLNDLMAEARKLQQAVTKVKETAGQGWRQVEDLVEGVGEQSPPWPGASDGARSH